MGASASARELADKVGRDYTTVNTANWQNWRSWSLSNEPMAKVIDVGVKPPLSADGKVTSPRHLCRSPPLAFEGVGTMERKRQSGDGQIHTPICG